MELTLNEALQRLKGVTGSGTQYYACCPAHADKKASLSVSESAAGKLLLYCQAGCSFGAIVDALNSSTPTTAERTRKQSGTQKQEVAAYDYTDENGALLFQKLRYEPKSFSIRRPVGAGKWAYNRQGVKLVPYNLPMLVKSDVVYLVEGEKDVDTLRQMNIAASCSPDGAGGSGKFKDELVKWFADKSIYIIADNDAIGKSFSQEEARKLAPVAKSVKILDLLKICPALPEHGDITDVIELLELDAERTRDALTSLVCSTPEYALADNPAPLATLCAADVEVKAVSWLWRDVFVQGGLNSIQGIAGIGKTYLLCAVCAAVSNGGEVQGVGGYMERVNVGKVLYLSGDDDPATTLIPRMKTFQANLRNIHFAPSGKMPPIGSSEFASYFEAVKPSICIVDTLQHFIPPRTSVNAANETTAALQPLKVLAEQYNCAVVVIQHINKMAAGGTGGNYSVNFGIGSAAVNGLFRSVWTLGRLKGEDEKPSETRVLAPSKTNLVVGDAPAVCFNLSAERGFEWAGVNYELTAEQLYNPLKRPAHRPPNKRDTVKEIIRDLLKNGGMVSSKLQETVIEKADCSERTYKTACAELELKRYQSGRQWYTALPDEQ